MSNHGRKMVAPIVVTVIVLLYYVLYFGVLLSLLHGIFRVLLGILPLFFGAVLIKVCVERIKEIKKGEEDDLSQY